MNLGMQTHGKVSTIDHPFYIIYITGTCYSISIHHVLAYLPFQCVMLLIYLQLCLDGRVQPVLKSQKKVKQKGPVTVVVGSNFRDIVYDKTKDVLIEFYAPWCGHCKQLEPKYKQLAKKYSKVKNLTIAKFDATANDAPAEFEVKGFPTIFFVAAGELNQVVKYEGGREVDDFSSFLEENAIHSLGKQPKQEL